MSETWRPVDGFGYEVSDTGRVRSARGELKRQLDRSGYLFVCLYSGGGGTFFRIHQLVMTAFVGPRPEGMLVRHLDDQKLNNHVANLAYGTLSDNAFDAVRNGRNHHANKTACINGHEFTPENTYMRTGWRHCRACNAAAQQRRKARLKAAS